MPPHPGLLTQTYYELSSLYKNPTKSFGGKAASNQNVELANKHRRLLELFNREKEKLAGMAEKPAVYFKVLALLYEIDNYRGAPPSAGDLILTEWESTLSDLKEQPDARENRPQGSARREIDFTDADVRSLWKAKVLCGVAAVEMRRKSSRLDDLFDELYILEAFVERKLHKPNEGLPSWTMLAFVQAAQARVARQGQLYDYVQEKLMSVLQCLDERAAEIIQKLSALERSGDRSQAEERKINELTDDLVFIRQKQTLSSLFNIGLANLQRGFLRSAEYACQAARLQFRLHGQFFHRLYNELALLSIRRARTSAENREELCTLKTELEQSILRQLEPKGDDGNPKLYLYALREMAVLQSSCGETNEMLDSVEAMERVGPLGAQWKSRTSILRARRCYQQYRMQPLPGVSDDDLLREALAHSEAAFKYATGLSDEIGSYRDAKSLLAEVERSVNKSLIDTIESLVTYGTVQLFLNDPGEAIKSARAVTDLSLDDNPRLLAMGYLVLAEAHIQTEHYMEAHRHLVSAKALESQIDHKYVEDRRRAVEDLMPEYLDLSGTKTLDEAEELLLGWFIDRRSSKRSVNKVAEEIGKDRKTVDSYLDRLHNPENENSPFRHLRQLAGNRRKRKKRKKST